MNTMVWVIKGYMHWSVRRLQIVTTFLLLIPITAYSAPLGLPDNTAKIGYSIGTASISIEDPDGTTEDNWAAQPFTLIFTDWFIKDIRQWTEIYYFETALDADATTVGQNVERYGVRFTLQKSYRLTQSWSPWFGAGLDLSSTNYNTRHTKDAEGFLIEAYDDRDETNVSLLVNFLSEWSLQKDWTIGAKLQQLIPTGDDISEFSAALTILYRY